MSKVDEALSMLEQFSAVEKIQVIERLVGMLGREIPQEPAPLKSLYGLWADLNIDVSEEDIAEVRREMWANFPREDII